MTPAASRRRNRSSIDAASVAAPKIDSARPRAVTGSGCTTARLSIQGSRGRTQVMRSDGTPLVSSQTMASDAVFPDPTMTNRFGCLGEVAQLVDRDDPSAFGHTEGRWGGRRDRRREVGGVHDAAPYVDLDGLAGDERRDVRRARVFVVLAPAEKRDTAGADQAVVQHVVVVVLDLRSPGAFMQSRLGAGGLHRAGTEHRGRHSVELRRLVELDERVGVLPVAAGRVPSVHEGHVHVCVVDQGVGECHAHGSGADDQVVGAQRPQRHHRAPYKAPACPRGFGPGCFVAQCSEMAFPPTSWLSTSMGCAGSRGMMKQVCQASRLTMLR